MDLDNNTRNYILSIATNMIFEAIPIDYRRETILRGIMRNLAIDEGCIEIAKTVELSRKNI